MGIRKRAIWVEDKNGGVHCTPLGVLGDGEVDSLRRKRLIHL